MHDVVISGTGLWVAPGVITNEELVASFNAYARRYNEANAAAIAAGELAAVAESSVEFIEKASGIGHPAALRDRQGRRARPGAHAAASRALVGDTT